ncbi:hypothetical protein D3C87_2029550 [compost metagenome]
MNSSFLNDPCQNRESGNAHGNSHKQTKREKFHSFGGKFIINKIGQTNSESKRNNNTGMTNDNRFVRFIFQDFQIKFHPYDNHEKN